MQIRCAYGISDRSCELAQRLFVLQLTGQLKRPVES